MEAAALRGTPLAAGHVLDLIAEIRSLRAYLREKNELLKAFIEAGGGRNPEELAYYFEEVARQKSATVSDKTTKDNVFR
jgi:hypothetical protein